jgi:hypothetical protein
VKRHVRHPDRARRSVVIPTEAQRSGGTCGFNYRSFDFASRDKAARDSAQDDNLAVRKLCALGTAH